MQIVHCDFLFCGAGLASLSLATAMAKDPFFKNKKIVLLESNSNKKNDRTWSFWADEDNKFASLTNQKWEKIKIHDGNKPMVFSTLPLIFYTLKSAEFYKTSLKILQEAGIEIIHDKICSATDNGEQVHVTTESGKTYWAAKVFNSIFDSSEIEKQNRYPYIKQHFVGWWVETENPVFEETTASFMDFSVAQMQQTRFMYLLPLSPNKALVEYTLFTENILLKTEYETAIKNYLEKLNAGKYTVIESEQGNIPMTAYRFDRKNSRNLMFIGTAGGWTKASTGFTFTQTQKKVQKLIEFLKKEDDLRKFKTASRFRFYDMLLLDVLHQNNALGVRIFSQIFQKNPTTRVLRFLDGETRFVEELKIIFSCPKTPFIKAFLKRLLRFSF